MITEQLIGLWRVKVSKSLAYFIFFTTISCTLTYISMKSVLKMENITKAAINKRGK